MVEELYIVFKKKSKENNGIAGTLCFSGSICADKLLLKNCPSAQHSIKVWQPPLAWGLKASIVKPLMPKFVQRNITMEDVENAADELEHDNAGEELESSSSEGSSSVLFADPAGDSAGVKPS